MTHDGKLVTYMNDDKGNRVLGLQAVSMRMGSLGAIPHIGRFCKNLAEVERIEADARRTLRRGDSLFWAPIAPHLMMDKAGFLYPISDGINGRPVAHLFQVANSLPVATYSYSQATANVQKLRQLGAELLVKHETGSGSCWRTDYRLLAGDFRLAASPIPDMSYSWVVYYPRNCALFSSALAEFGAFAVREGEDYSCFDTWQQANDCATALTSDQSLVVPARLYMVKAYTVEGFDTVLEAARNGYVDWSKNGRRFVMTARQAFCMRDYFTRERQNATDQRSGWCAVRHALFCYSVEPVPTNPAGSCNLQSDKRVMERVIVTEERK